MKNIILIMAYYGKLPDIFPVWLQSVKNNPTVDFCFFSDCIRQEDVPQNVKVIDMAGEAFVRRIRDRFDFEVSINNYGRISQFRPAFAHIFPEVVDGYDFWGYVECDLILGDIRHFITDELLDQYDKFFKLGHLQLFRNCPEMNTLFMQKTPAALNYRYAYSKDVLFFEEIIGMTNIADAKGVKTYSENVFSDLNMFELMFTRGTFTYDALSPQEQLFEYDRGKLYSYAVNGSALEKREILYVHFQKRAMAVDTSDYDRYIIVPNRFAEWRRIDKEYLDEVRADAARSADDYRNTTAQKLRDVKKQRLKTWEWRMLYLIRLRVFLFGGIDLSGKSWKKH